MTIETQSTALIPAADACPKTLEHEDRIAYQHSAIVQAYAALVTLEPDGLRPVQATANLGCVLGVSGGLGGGLGGGLEDLLDAASAAAVRRAAAEEGSADADGGRARVLGALRSAGGRPLVGRVHHAEGLVLLELEPETAEDDLTAQDLWSRLGAYAERVQSRSTLAETVDGIACGLRDLVGFDRCMVYRFDADWNGEVIAESRGPEARDSFAGLHFPARDIPSSVREMFAACPVRVTVDQQADPQPIVPRMSPVTGRDVDLTRVRCRAADGPCRTYYLNMGVRATIVMPIHVAGRLWGLLSCHHGRACRPNAMADAPLAIARRMAESAIEHYLLEEQQRAERRAAELNRALAAAHPHSADWPDRLREQVTAFRELIGSDGFALRVGEATHRDGLTPDQSGLYRIFDALVPHAGGRASCTNNLARDWPALADLAPAACGVLVVPLGLRPGDAAIWFRREHPETVSWAGDPEEGTRWEQTGRPVLTPRASFELWRTRTAGVSRHWTDFERHVAQSAATNIGLMLLSWHTAQASRSKSEFLANMSHEIRTPMTAILGFADLLGEGETSRERLEYLDTIRRNGRHLLGVIGDILDLSRLEAGQLTLVPKPVDPRAAIDECVRLLESAAREKGITLRTRLEPGLAGEIRTDPVRLRQVLLNLAGNAVKFTASGSVTLVAAPASRGVEFGVIDTGIGMGADQIERVLHPFEQADTGVTRRYGGMGLGLSICTRLVAKLGGSMRIESESGRGTAVWFRIDDAGE